MISNCSQQRVGSLTGGDEDEGGAGVDNAGGAGEDARAIVRDGLVDAPVVGRRGRRRQGAVCARERGAIVQVA